MAWLILIVSLGILLFGFVVIFGAPYLPTLKRQTETALDLLDLKPGQTLLELGSGDGRVLRAAAKRGLNCVGFELNPLLVIVSLLLTWGYRERVTIIWGNYWAKRWPQADGIFTFLISHYMEKLDKKIIQEIKHPVKLVSFAFEVPHRKAAKSSQGLFLYNYPATGLRKR